MFHFLRREELKATADRRKRTQENSSAHWFSRATCIVGKLARRIKFLQFRWEWLWLHTTFQKDRKLWKLTAVVTTWRLSKLMIAGTLCYYRPQKHNRWSSKYCRTISRDVSCMNMLIALIENLLCIFGFTAVHAANLRFPDIPQDTVQADETEWNWHGHVDVATRSKCTTLYNLYEISYPSANDLSAMDPPNLVS